MYDIEVKHILERLNLVSEHLEERDQLLIAGILDRIIVDLEECLNRKGETNVKSA